MDMESEQNEKPSYGGDTRRLVSETSRPPNTEEGNRFDCPWTDCVLERKSDDISSVVIQRDDREVEFNKLTIYESEHSIVYSGTAGRNSDIAAMSDFSDDEEETQVELRPTGTRFVCQWIMLLHYTNVLLGHNERIPNFAEQSAQFLLLYS